MIISGTFSKRVVLLFVFMPWLTFSVCIPLSAMNGRTDVSHFPPRDFELSALIDRGWAYPVGTVGMTLWAFLLMALGLRLSAFHLAHCRVLPVMVSSRVRWRIRILLMSCVLTSCGIAGMGVIEWSYDVSTHTRMASVAFPLGLSLVYQHWSFHGIVYKHNFMRLVLNLMCAFAMSTLLGLVYSFFYGSRLAFILWEWLGVLALSTYWFWFTVDEAFLVNLNLFAYDGSTGPTNAADEEMKMFMGAFD
eukprot:TRINITY_DN12277_c0_g1_i1.p1 TRINITY_DN12277_c0_g1~~TRINITY_DN12277_c0_g1_i1.p1  ORF type:complete len:248 (+),score=13.09 TRINITY_DN12277_c0_g1_i1:1-744(+)